MNKPTQAVHLCRVMDLGLLSHSEAYKIQQAAVKEVSEGAEHILFLCEHFPILTLGRLATEENFLCSASDIRQKGVEISRIDRGGEVTFHGPGQLVIYPVLRLDGFGKDLKLYLHQLEQVAIDLLSSFGIVADRISGRRGVWAKTDKIASIGIGVRKWVSFHGMAVNINTDLSYFDLIKPCGLDVAMTSVARLNGAPVDMQKAKKETVKSFENVFGVSCVWGGIDG